MSDELRAEYVRLWRRRRELEAQLQRLRALVEALGAKRRIVGHLAPNELQLLDELAENERLLDAVRSELGARWQKKVQP